MEKKICPSCRGEVPLVADPLSGDWFARCVGCDIILLFKSLSQGPTTYKRKSSTRDGW